MIVMTMMSDDDVNDDDSDDDVDDGYDDDNYDDNDDKISHYIPLIII